MSKELVGTERGKLHFTHTKKVLFSVDMRPDVVSLLGGDLA